MIANGILPQQSPALLPSIDEVNRRIQQIDRQLRDFAVRPEVSGNDPDQIVSYGMARRYTLIDLWADVLPNFFEPQVRYLRQHRVGEILNH